MPGVLMLEAMTQAGAWLVRLSEDFAHSMVLLKQATNVKYGQFVEPGQTLTVTAEIISQDRHGDEGQGPGTVDGRTTVSGRLVLERYNLADPNPAEADRGRGDPQEMRDLLKVLVPARPPACLRLNSVAPRSDIDTVDVHDAMRFEGKTALVTGGSRGIGRALRGQLAAEGRHRGLRLQQRTRPRPRALVAELAAQAARSGPSRPTSATAKRAHQIVDSSSTSGSGSTCWSTRPASSRTACWAP